MKEKIRRIEVHLGASILKTLDGWRREQHDFPSRRVAIRRLVEYALAGNSTTIPHQPRKGGRRKAAEMASKEIDRLGDQSVTNEEQTRRKRRLIKGPQEFRDVRTDLPKTKS
jgi:metal-responsive CopG/Arc/MetJ family transcriptional regulator